MKKILSCAIATAFSMAMISPSLADLIDNSGPGFSIPDNDPAGASSSIVIGANEIISDVDVTLFGADHTWVGDLVATIEHVDTATGATLFFRTGQIGISSGDSSNLSGNYTFSDGGADWWAEAAARTGGEALTPGTYAASGFENAAVSLAAIFSGQSTAGTWTLTISDNSQDDFGLIAGWGLSFTSTPIPEPGTFGVLTFAGVGLLVRRRR